MLACGLSTRRCVIARTSSAQPLFLSSFFIIISSRVTGNSRQISNKSPMDVDERHGRPMKFAEGSYSSLFLTSFCLFLFPQHSIELKDHSWTILQTKQNGLTSHHFSVIMCLLRKRLTRYIKIESPSSAIRQK